jgi:hypothetical protein
MYFRVDVHARQQQSIPVHFLAPRRPSVACTCEATTVDTRASSPLSSPLMPIGFVVAASVNHEFTFLTFFALICTTR